MTRRHLQLIAVDNGDRAIPSRLASARKRQALKLFAGLPRHYDLIAALFSFGQDPRWRRTMVRALRPSVEDRVLDVATGTGMVAEALVRSSGCTVVALDQSEPMLARARHRLDGNPVLGDRVTVVRGEAENLPFAGWGVRRADLHLPAPLRR